MSHQMLGAHFQTCPITEDPDPLPSDFYTEENRKCEFFTEDRSLGSRGIAYAVVLRAIEDGVCEKWLRLLSQFYEIPIPEALLSRRPERRLRINMLTQRVGTAAPARIMLSWFDYSPIREQHITRVA